MKFVLARYFMLSLSLPPAVSATSSVELQSAAGGGGELHDPKGSQKHDQHINPKIQPNSQFKTRPKSVGFGLRCPTRALKIPRAGPANLRVAEALPHSVRFALGARPSRRYCVALAEDNDLKVATIPAPAPTNSVGFRQRRPARASRMPRRRPGGS